ncbi:hypothetical protein E6A45_02345 [Brachyspira pilosicoli]|uniref:Lipoprotein n=1 Tax=Brachyspira pilosicoli P43/6/78 TaxID=1042417 RepID=A0A3B6VI61_BRAPL|nr:hypothetical protein [Brachyspira pilosicoli]AGA65616.1 hypothetical protein BPP43_01350 [Brachyspira pilosicoli P43/6/78]MBW5377479.1 hypothetical protein [Brachyspira pilosicoli]WIH82144.1 hypothetical protein NEI04_03975 [Brachyspira pilosicoli]SUW07502.1 Uncharacterised protein [Brachyspira pilosicoli]
MKRIISFVTIFLSIIFFISCKANTGPIEQSEKTAGIVGKGLKSSSPVLATTYLWVTLDTDGSTTSTINLQFGDNGTTAPQNKGEEVKFNGNIEHISPTANENANSYAFQSGTVTGVVEILSETQVKVSFSRNISPYLKINDVVCTAQ